MAKPGEGFRFPSRRKPLTWSRRSRSAGPRIWLLALLLGSCTSVSPQGPWIEIRSGSSGDLDWTLFATRPSDGTRCFAVETNPSPAAVETESTELYRGKVPSCSTIPGDQPLTSYVSLVGPSRIGSKFAYIAGLVAPSIESVDVVLSSSDQRSIQTVETDDGFFVLVFQDHLSPDRLLISTKAGISVCPPDRLSSGHTYRFAC